MGDGAYAIFLSYSSADAGAVRRSLILVRAGRTSEGYAEVARLLHVPFAALTNLFEDGTAEMLLAVKDDPHYDEIVNNPPRL